MWSAWAGEITQWLRAEIPVTEGQTRSAVPESWTESSREEREYLRVDKLFGALEARLEQLHHDISKTWKEQVIRSRTNPMKSCKARAGNQVLILDSKKGRKSMQSAEGCLPPLFTTQYQISVWKTMKGYSTHPRGPHLGILKKSL